MDKIYYLYGIIRDEFNIGEIKGIDNKNPLFLIGDEHLKAVVSFVDSSEYDEEILAVKAEDLNWLAEKASAHMEIITQIHSLKTIIPVKFCTLFTDEAGILKMLESSRLKYRHLLKRLNGKDEYGIKIYVNESIFLPPELMETHKTFEQSIKGVGKGKAFMLKKTQAAKTEVKKEALIGIYRDRIWQILLDLNPTGKINKTVTSELTGKKERMLLNGVFLVEKNEGTDFLKKADLALQACLVPGIYLEASGPWPLYNFCA